MESFLSWNGKLQYHSTLFQKDKKKESWDNLYFHVLYFATVWKEKHPNYTCFSFSSPFFNSPKQSTQTTFFSLLSLSNCQSFFQLIPISLPQFSLKNLSFPPLSPYLLLHLCSMFISFIISSFTMSLWLQVWRVLVTPSRSTNRGLTLWGCYVEQIRTTRLGRLGAKRWHHIHKWKIKGRMPKRDFSTFTQLSQFPSLDSFILQGNTRLCQITFPMYDGSHGSYLWGLWQTGRQLQKQP